jgi:hypothetical protein
MNDVPDTAKLDEQGLRDIGAAVEALGRPLGDEPELKMDGPEPKMSVAK